MCRHAQLLRSDDHVYLVERRNPARAPARPKDAAVVVLPTPPEPTQTRILR